MDSTKQKIGRKIKELRKRSRMTQQQLAEAIEVDAHHISRLENGGYFPGLDTLERMAKVLGIDMRAFFDFPETEGSEEMRAYLRRLADELPEEKLRNVVRAIRSLPDSG